VPAQSTMINLSANHGSRWPFPGRRAAQPMNPHSLAASINDLGIPTTASRAATIRQHIFEVPAPVVADALDYHQVTTAKLASQTGATWSRYAVGNHLRSPFGWTPQRIHDS